MTVGLSAGMGMRVGAGWVVVGPGRGDEGADQPDESSKVRVEWCESTNGGLTVWRPARGVVSLTGRLEGVGEGVSQSPPHSPHTDPMKHSQSLGVSVHSAEQTSLTL